MAEYVCSVCGYIYEEIKGIPEAGVAPGTTWAELPEAWVCPLCGAAKTEFQRQAGSAAASDKRPASVVEASQDQEMSPLEMSALCTNLARGCEKQYKSEEAALFNELAGYFKSVATPAEAPGFAQLITLIEHDIQAGFPAANAAAADDKDRGALRALVWSEKVTRILKSILSRYQAKGEALYEDTGIYVCSICGFVYIGDIAPDICPVCKVPNWKIERVKER